MPHHQRPNLFSAIAIGIGCVIGSGWLFASYKAAKFAGPVAIVSWIVGAIIALLIALLLAEIATLLHKETGLFARLLSLTHNRDYGFVVSSSNWFATIITIPAEAEASMQYLAEAFPTVSQSLFNNDHFTALGTVCVCAIMFLYGILNYWGIQLLTKTNNAITMIKLTIPTLTAIIIAIAAFHPGNFTSYHQTIAPYGYGSALTAVVTCGIFYSFYGFSMITIFAKELQKPQRNIPLALGGSVVLCLIIYLMLQVSFLGAINPTVVAAGWHTLNFSSPLAQLSILLGLNWLSLILYVDAAISPSGTGIIYVGSSTRMFTGMAHDHQMPAMFGKEHPVHGVSRLSIVVTLALCMILVIFFDNWDKIMIVVSVFQLISCVAVPIAFWKLRQNNRGKRPPFKMPCGKTVGYIAYLILTYLLIQCGTTALVLSFLFHTVFFSIYCGVYYQNFKETVKAAASAWSIFCYLGLTVIFGFLQEHHQLDHPLALSSFLVCSTILYYFLLKQKSYH
ncbi:MAG: amino acid permease [Gammaproteobacteria bacterium RIFCSPHIGHO2_12_FULL_45_9]|nr:MAG: amino acid permease [Gammaproteobacteria bacterium RIFCSPHIGHO2_12_FULL_45_9]